MKKLISIATLTIFLAGCNMNPNKEVRIQSIETKTQQTVDLIKKLENRIQALEVENEQLVTRLNKIEAL